MTRNITERANDTDRCRARARRPGGGLLSVIVGDNGRGGARLDAGTGLQGVARRLESFDGMIELSSPPGGPTTVTMEVPCELSSLKT